MTDWETFFNKHTSEGSGASFFMFSLFLKKPVETSRSIQKERLVSSSVGDTAPVRYTTTQSIELAIEHRVRFVDDNDLMSYFKYANRDANGKVVVNQLYGKDETSESPYLGRGSFECRTNPSTQYLNFWLDCEPAVVENIRDYFDRAVPSVAFDGYYKTEVDEGFCGSVRIDVLNFRTRKVRDFDVIEFDILRIYLGQ
jgi:hypothetical protein